MNFLWQPEQRFQEFHNEQIQESSEVTTSSLNVVQIQESAELNSNPQNVVQIQENQESKTKPQNRRIVVVETENLEDSAQVHLFDTILKNESIAKNVLRQNRLKNCDQIWER